MANNRQTVTLLRKNKQEQVAVLQALGFENVTESTKASLFPIYAKWANGLLDCTIAANRISDDKAFYFTKEEWSLMNNTQRMGYLIRGIRLRSHGMSFVIATNVFGGAKWGAATDNAYVPNYTNSSDLYKDRKAERYNTLLLASQSGNGTTAIELCHDYKAYTQAIDGRDDNSTWVIGCVAHYVEVHRFRDEIDNCLAVVYGNSYAQQLRGEILTCNEYDATRVWGVNITSGRVYYDYSKNSTSFYYLPISIEV